MTHYNHNTILPALLRIEKSNTIQNSISSNKSSSVDYMEVWLVLFSQGPGLYEGSLLSINTDSFIKFRQ